MTNRDRALRLISVLGAASLAALVIAACSSSREEFPSDPPSFPSDANAPEAPACGLHCSRDLKQVLDGCEGAETIVAECNADQGCGGGRCTDACTAAALNKGSAGCDFWTLPPEDHYESPGSCFVTMIANTWDRAVNLSAEYEGAALDISKSTYTVERKDGDAAYTLLAGQLPPGQVAVVFLAHNESTQSDLTQLCPRAVTPALLFDPLRHGTTRTTAFHLKTDAPVAAYSMFPYNGGADTLVPTATLLLPVTSWDKIYFAVSPNDFSEFNYKRTLQIVANENDTEVLLRPTVEVTSGSGVAGATTGVTQTYTLQRGEVLQFSQVSMAGSPIVTNKPVAVFGGSVCTHLPDLYCDVLQQQIPPFAQWGTEYAAIPYKPRIDSFSPDIREKVPYSIVGGADGTVLTYDPSRPLGAPDKVDAGQMVSFMTDEYFAVRSQDSKHPFYASVYMTSSLYGNGTGKETLGDPDFVNIPPTDQFLDRYVFFTDFTYPETTVTIVRKKTAKGVFLPVELECAGEVTGWKPVGNEGKYEFAWVQLTSGFVPQKFPKGECTYGRQEAHSDAPFAVTVWGTGIRASYGYVGGTGLRPINDAKPPTVQ